MIGNAIVSMVETDFNCPKCNHAYTEADYYKQLSMSENCLIYKTCKSCKTKLGITVNMVGDTVVWEKTKEEKLTKNK